MIIEGECFPKCCPFNFELFSNWPGFLRSGTLFPTGSARYLSWLWRIIRFKESTDVENIVCLHPYLFVLQSDLIGFEKGSSIQLFQISSVLQRQINIASPVWLGIARTFRKFPLESKQYCSLFLTASLLLVIQPSSLWPLLHFREAWMK